MGRCEGTIEGVQVWCGCAKLQTSMQASHKGGTGMHMYMRVWARNEGTDEGMQAWNGCAKAQIGCTGMHMCAQVHISMHYSW